MEDLDSAASLLEGASRVPKMEGIKTVDAKMSSLLHPSRAGGVLNGVHDILNTLLLRFNEEFEGVILAYLPPRIQGRRGKILSGLTPYFRVNFTVKLLLFSPNPGMKIEGKVNKIEKDYLGVLVLGLFNSIIGVSDVRDDLDYSAKHEGQRAWISTSDDRHVIKLGSLIRFSVKSLQETEHIIDICGSMVEGDTGCVDWLEMPRLASRIDSKEGTVSEGATLRSSDHGEQKQKKKKKKKRKKEKKDKQQDVEGQLQEPEQNLPDPKSAEGINEKPADASKSKKKRKATEHDVKGQLQEPEQNLPDPKSAEGIKEKPPDASKSKKKRKATEYDVKGQLQEPEENLPDPKSAEGTKEEPPAASKSKKKKKRKTTELSPFVANHKSERKKVKGELPGTQ